MTEILIGWAAAILRVIFGIMMAFHGWPKLRAIHGTAAWVESIGFRPGMMWAVGLVLTEFIGGIALVLGIFTRIAAGLLAIEFLIIMFLKIFPWKKQFATGDGEWDFDLVFFAIAIALILLGAGNWSIDQAIGWKLG